MLYTSLDTVVTDMQARLDCIASALLVLAELNRLSGTSFTSLAAALRGLAGCLPLDAVETYKELAAKANIAKHVRAPPGWR